MLIDFSPVDNHEMHLIEFSQRFSIDDLRAATNTHIDMLLDIIADADDAQIAYIPDDPFADDPEADNPEDRYLGWSLAHLIVHVTASAEESAGQSSMLARGISLGGRQRYETYWRTVTTKAQAVQRLEESRRMCLAYLAAWPDVPMLDVYRDVSPRFTERNGLMNATATYLYGLKHTDGHIEQLRETARQAREAARVSAGK